MTATSPLGAATPVGSAVDQPLPDLIPLWENRTPIWARESQLQWLAYEIARYDPELATGLVAAGVDRLRNEM
ncbi:MAG: hypothetical protein KDK99_19610 [Verrucomicrobiales bacterium]|nr:hypothetical protein [Verrucomicrobiales bacterium]